MQNIMSPKHEVTVSPPKKFENLGPMCADVFLLTLCVFPFYMLIIFNLPHAFYLHLFLFFVLFAIFILHSRESELYRYTLDRKSALAWELPFSRFFLWATCLPHKGGASR